MLIIRLFFVFIARNTCLAHLSIVNAENIKIERSQHLRKNLTCKTRTKGETATGETPLENNRPATSRVRTTRTN